MRRFHFIFILFLPLLLFLILKGGRFFFNTNIYAQDDGSCWMGGAYSGNPPFTLIDKNIRIANGSTVCQFIHYGQSDFGSSSFYHLFEIVENSLDFSTRTGDPDELHRKTYFECRNGVWQEKQTASYCQNREGDELINNIYIYSIGSMDNPLSLNVTERTLATSTPTPNFSDIDLATDDVYGLTCGVPGSSQRGGLFSEDHARCCSIPRGYNTQDEIKKASESLGCLIDWEILGKELRYLCFGGIVDSLLGMLKMDDLLFTIRQNPLSQAVYETQACVEGVPLIPKEKQRTPNSAISSFPGNSITPRPTIMISHQSYVIATNEELGREFNCQCHIVPNSLLDLCDHITGDSHNACLECVQNDKLYTALGCFPLNIRTFIQETMFRFLIGLAGMITLFCIIYSALQLQLSRGSPEKIKKSQEMLTSCITGLILIIFSVFILKLIGVDILKIPGFN